MIPGDRWCILDYMHDVIKVYNERFITPGIYYTWISVNWQTRDVNLSLYNFSGILSQLPITPHCVNYSWQTTLITKSGLRQNGQHFLDETLKSILLYENCWTQIQILLKSILKFPINK